MNWKINTKSIYNRTKIILIVCLPLVLCQRTGYAFDSFVDPACWSSGAAAIGMGDVHGGITTRAVSGLGLCETAIANITNESHDLDWRESRISNPLSWGNLYKQEHHFDRDPIDPAFNSVTAFCKAADF